MVVRSMAVAGMLALGVWSGGARADLPQELPLYFGWSEATEVSADYDGDGKTDPAVYYPPTGAWHVWSSLDGMARVFYWGWSGALPLAGGDYDGDGCADLCVYEPEVGGWYILQSRSRQPLALNWGWSEALPVPGDYDGDGRTDRAVYDPPSGAWYIEPLRHGEVTDPATLWQMYSNAVADAHQPSSEKICRALIPITEENPSLLWVAGKVCVTMFTDWGGYTNYVQKDYTLSPTRELWVTPSTQMRDFCASYRGGNIRLRLCQYLGLPPSKTNSSYVVEFLVDPAVLFRPSPDPEITDREAELHLRTNSAFQAVSANHAAWIEYNRQFNTYPWSSLGYTYDWALPVEQVFGASEYVVQTGSTVFVQGVFAVETYGKNP